jgi:hypothetical protein
VRTRGARDGKPSRAGRSALQLCGDHLDERNIDDPRIPAMFADLLDEFTGSPEDAALAGET